MGATTGIMDATPADDRFQLIYFKDVPSLLVHLKLDQYIGTYSPVDAHVATDNLFHTHS